jgi:hypothetical protein
MGDLPELLVAGRWRSEKIAVNDVRGSPAFSFEFVAKRPRAVSKSGTAGSLSRPPGCRPENFASKFRGNLNGDYQIATKERKEHKRFFLPKKVFPREREAKVLFVIFVRFKRRIPPLATRFQSLDFALLRATFWVFRTRSSIG